MIVRVNEVPPARPMRQLPVWRSPFRDPAAAQRRAILLGIGGTGRFWSALAVKHDRPGCPGSPPPCRAGGSARRPAPRLASRRRPRTTSRGGPDREGPNGYRRPRIEIRIGLGHHRGHRAAGREARNEHGWPGYRSGPSMIPGDAGNDRGLARNPRTWSADGTSSSTMTDWLTDLRGIGDHEPVGLRHFVHAEAGLAKSSGSCLQPCSITRRPRGVRRGGRGDVKPVGSRARRPGERLGQVQGAVGNLSGRRRDALRSCREARGRSRPPRAPCASSCNTSAQGLRSRCGPPAARSPRRRRRLNLGPVQGFPDRLGRAGDIALADDQCGAAHRRDEISGSSNFPCSGEA